MKSSILSMCFLICGAGWLSLAAQDAERDYAFDNYRKYLHEVQQTQDAAKEKAITAYRDYYSKHPFSRFSSPVQLTAPECLALLNNEGRFSDFEDKEKEIQKNKYIKSGQLYQQGVVGSVIFDAYNRIWKIAEACRSGELPVKDVFIAKYCKAILHYGDMEVRRMNNSNRWHASCFGAPTAAANTYLCFLGKMDEAESVQCGDSLQVQACDMLKVIALQSWTQPLRGDATDKNVVQIERFRHHVWWVGGNAVGYRSLFLCALLYKSAPMLDLLAEIGRKSISYVSQHTYNEAFWTEGFTADGAGWGHGKQCLIWGYPIDGTENAIKLLSVLKNSPWEQKLSPENIQALMNFFRGGAWYYYKGYILPCLDRNSALYDGELSRTIPYSRMLNMLLEEWGDSFSPEQLDELRTLQSEVTQKSINMEAYPQGMYHGTRWFFNNDDLIKKNKQYHIIVNMASRRCDGLESATNFADNYNFYTNDGLTLFQRNGNEYRQIIGAWDVTAYPGVTAREGMENLKPITNWRGYCSKYNFAGAATRGGENAVAGFIYEKANGENLDDVSHGDGFYRQNPSIYHVRACKSYFMLGDFMVALGAGITNFKPEMRGHIRTTIEQTAASGRISLLENGKETMVAGGIQSLPCKKLPVWVSQQGGFAYTLLPPYTKNAYLVRETKANEWVERNVANRQKKELPPQADILRLWIDHGQRPVNDTYGYTVYCGEGLPPAKLPFAVLRNDTIIQAVQSTDKKIIEAVFYNANEILSHTNLNIGVSAPVTLLIEDTGSEYVVTANDPQMNKSLKQIDIIFNKKKITVDMPQGVSAGKPATVRIGK
jgi:hypothetical protein